MHLSKRTSVPPAYLKVRIASSISATVAIPVDIIAGFPVEATFLINGRSVLSNEAIL